MCKRNERAAGHLWLEDTFINPPKNIIRSWCVSCGARREARGVDIGEWRFTKHAVQRALDMAVSPDELREAVTEPERDEPSPARYPEECRLYSRGRISLAVNSRTKEVITVMWDTGGYFRIERDEDDELWWRD